MMPITVKQIAEALNSQIDIPILGEAQEQLILESALESIWPVVPEHVQELILDAADGLDEAEIAEHTEKITDLAVELATSGVPFWLRLAVRSVAPMMIRPIVARLLSFARKGFSLELAV